MSSWEENNRAYLLAVCQGLRLRLRRLVGDEAVTAEMIAEAEAAITEAAGVEPPPAAIDVSYRFNLSELEKEILLLCVAMEVDPLLPELCDRAQGDRGWAFPTFALGFQLFEEVRWDVMTVDAPLRYWRLVELHGAQPQPLPQTMLKADERIVNHIMGSGRLDHRLESLLMPLMGAGQEKLRISESQQVVVSELCESLARAKGALPIVQLLGTSEETKSLVAQVVAGQFGAQLYGLMGELIPTGNSDFSQFLRLWERETYLSRVGLFIDTQELEAEAQSKVSLRRFLSQCSGLVFVDSREVRLPSHRQAITREVAKPTPLEQREAWIEVLGKEEAAQAAVLSCQFCLNLSEIEEIGIQNAKVKIHKEEEESNALKIASNEMEEKGKKGKGKREDRSGSVPPSLFPLPPFPILWNACLNRTRPRLESLAQRIDVKATWDQLVLPDEAMGVLRQIVDQVRLRSKVYDDWGFRERMNRGLGVSAMFAGPSGTGKTMAAEVIANELNLHLYRIDLSSVVSKYIGETEKNLRRLFDAAEEGGAILFFDEADALFGKRSEVKDSHDRYANVEINYLLQRIEAYRGVAVLATNLRGALDNAFLRRLRFLVEFPFPTKEKRQEMWRKVFPEGMTHEALDDKRLGRFNVTGGTIQSVAINAAFMSVANGGGITMNSMLEAMRDEYRKQGRPVHDVEFKNEAEARAEEAWESTSGWQRRPTGGVNAEQITGRQANARAQSWER
ncbi:ATPase, AAA family protein [Synechococcus sp. PCC 7335]|uniref:ATP-binding protein n=1 Tax=Synechococcus sp. (strain ATCC 29403 / PCC 7335) TaxID=91464 RepID=UPI00017ED669|nr:ATP-binding protein [Synechococcus sp. PCC 7335]EDX83454.1 ATPase, AAA family protein [Synechococcus sp. PCC 7335]